MYFCDDVDLMVWEPGIFGETAFGHQCLVKGAAGTLAGTGLTMGAGGAGVLGGIVPGMVAMVDSGGGLTQLLEIVAVADEAHATVSSLRGRDNEPAIAGLSGGAVSVTVMSFRPQIAAVGDELLGLLGVTSDRVDAGGEVERPRGFRTACVLGVLAAVFRVVAAGSGATAAQAARRDFYDKMYAEARREVRGRVEGRERRAAVGELVRY